MRYIQLGQFSASVIGLGTWQIGTQSWGWGTEFDTNSVTPILKTAAEVGINFIDTAEIYGKGESERQLGSYLQDVRAQFLIASKVSPWHLTSTKVYKAALNSLNRLQMDSIDLYQIHVPNPLISLNSTISGMKKLMQEGKIKEIGVSNFSLNRWLKTEKILNGNVVTNQVEFNLLHPQAIVNMNPQLQNNHVMIAYSPLAMGLLSGKYDNVRKPTNDRLKNPAFSSRNFNNVERVMQVVRRIATSHGSSISQIALAWVISHPNVIAIPGAKSPEQVRENAAAADIALTESEFTDLTDVSRQYKESIHFPRGFEAFKWLFS